MSHARANLLLLGCAVIWGMGYLFQKSAMTHVGPMLFVAARCGLAALVLAPFAWLEHRRTNQPLGTRFILLGGLAGVVLASASIVQQIGIGSASVINTAFLTSLYVVVAPLLAWPLLRQRPPANVWLAVSLSFGGVWLLGGGGFTTFSSGEMMVLAATLLWAANVIVLATAARFERPALLTATQFAIASMMGLAGALATETIEAGALQRASIDIAYVGILSSALTFTIFAAALRRTSAAEACVIASSEALFAVLAAAAVLGERLTPAGYAGAGMVLVAGLMVQFAALRSRPRQ